MTKTAESIVFFGSGPVAAASLKLLANDFIIEAVITKPRPPHHTGDVPVIALAEELQIPILTAVNKQSLSELFANSSLQSRVAVLIDFGIIVAQDVIDFFPLGIVNSHFSLLPQWRGADPISFAILSGQPTTGVSLMLLVAGMDEGPILAYSEYEIPADCTTPQLTDALIELSAELLSHMLPSYMAGEIEVAPQSVEGVSYSRKLDKKDSVLDWNKPAVELEREVRAFYGWPRSRTTVAGHDLVITKAHVVDASGAPGTLWRDDKAFGVHCSEGSLVFDEVIPAGKKPMSAAAFLAGYTLQP
jgi:methionyl-tRNA formyltransferase